MTIDLTNILNTAILALIGAVSTAFLAWLQSHMKDKQAATVLSNAVKNSLGAIQQAGVNYVTTLSPSVRIPGVSPALATGIQYVLNNAGTEAARLGVTPEGIASKIDAQMGLVAVVAPAPGTTTTTVTP